MTSTESRRSAARERSIQDTSVCGGRSGRSDVQRRQWLRSGAPGWVLPLLVAVLIGGIGALNPVALIPLAAILVIALSLSCFRSGPETALMLCFFFIYFGETKFRYRDPNAALSTGADGQVIFELGFYALVFVIVAINWSRLKRSDLKAKPLELVILGYVLLAGLSTFWSFNPTITAVRAVQQFILYAFLFVAVR